MEHTAEWVSPNHPDKVCDCISDAILDECLRQDPNSRVAVETQAGHGTIMLAGEITTNANIDFTGIVYNTLDILHINRSDISVLQNIAKQSPEIAYGVDSG
jgi:S-adenosylmethionine synthetase